MSSTQCVGEYLDDVHLLKVEQQSAFTPRSYLIRGGYTGELKRYAQCDDIDRVYL